MIKKICLLGGLLLTFAQSLYAQDDLLNMLPEDSTAHTLTRATFKSTRVINGHSVETMPKKHLDFRISHRFGRLNSGPSELWGLDVARIRLGFDYGITDRLMIGVGRSSEQKLYDGFAKFKLLRQSTGSHAMPVSVVLFGGTYINTLQFSPEQEMTIKSRLSYCGQILVARKFSEKLSLQLMPTLLYRNRTNVIGESNAVLALGAAGRYKISKRVAINAEYYAVLPDQIDDKYHNSLAVGFDIETGGHVFSLHFVNSLYMAEKQFIAETEGLWNKGDMSSLRRPETSRYLTATGACSNGWLPAHTLGQARTCSSSPCARSRSASARRTALLRVSGAPVPGSRHQRRPFGAGPWRT